MGHHLVIAAIFRRENPYLREWLEFHRLVGVDHFYLYDDDGGAETRALLKPYVESGLVTLHPWTHLDGTRHDRKTRFHGRDKNHMAFGHAAKNYRHRFDWIMKIDLDEFLVPLKGESIPALLEQYDRRRIKGIRIPRINFGDCGHRTKPEGLVIESYTRREAEPSDHKDLGNNAFLHSNSFTNNAHSWGYWWFKRGRVVREREVHDMRVHHYYTKSFEEYLKRQNTPGTRPISEEGFRAKNAGRNDVLDERLLRFVPEVRRRLARSPVVSVDVAAR